MILSVICFVVGFGLGCIFWYRYGEEVIDMVDERLGGITTEEQQLKVISSLRKETARNILLTRFKLKKENSYLLDKSFEDLKIDIQMKSLKIILPECFSFSYEYEYQRFFDDVYDQLVRRENQWIEIYGRLPTDVELITLLGFEISEFYNIIEVDNTIEVE